MDLASMLQGQGGAPQGGPPGGMQGGPGPIAASTTVR